MLLGVASPPTRRQHSEIDEREKALCEVHAEEGRPWLAICACRITSGGPFSRTPEGITADRCLFPTPARISHVSRLSTFPCALHAPRACSTTSPPQMANNTDHYIILLAHFVALMMFTIPLTIHVTIDLPPPKRRKTFTGSIVSTALSAALIGTAVGLTVYRL